MKSERISYPAELTKKDLEQINLTIICKDLSNLTALVKNKTILITGGAGFLGSWFCQTGLELGAKVICVDNLKSGSFENISDLQAYSGFTVINADISTLAIPVGVDFIVHMASIASPPLYQKYPIETLNAAILGSINTLEYARSQKVISYLLTSTSEVYGNPPPEQIPTNEEYAGSVFSYGPRSMYDESKRVEEAYCYAYFNQHQVPIRIARIFNTYGPRIDENNLSNQYGRALIKFIRQAISNEAITVYGDGSSTRSFCYITDQIVGLFKLMLEQNIDGEVINIGNNEEVSMLYLATLIKELTQSQSEISLNADPFYDLSHDPQRRQPDITKAREKISFQPRVTLENGLIETIAWNKAKY